MCFFLLTEGRMGRADLLALWSLCPPPRGPATAPSAHPESSPKKKTQNKSPRCPAACEGHCRAAGLEAAEGGHGEQGTQRGMREKGGRGLLPSPTRPGRTQPTQGLVPGAALRGNK